MQVQLSPQGRVLQRVGGQPGAFIVVRQGVVRVQDRTTTAAGAFASMCPCEGCVRVQASKRAGQGARAGPHDNSRRCAGTLKCVRQLVHCRCHAASQCATHARVRASSPFQTALRCLSRPAPAHCSTWWVCSTAFCSCTRQAHVNAASGHAIKRRPRLAVQPGKLKAASSQLRAVCMRMQLQPMPLNAGPGSQGERRRLPAAG